MAHRDEIVDYANELLETHRFAEYGRPGLQVIGSDEVEKIACGVSASLELFRRAAERGAQLVIVHHGMFWRNEPLWIDRRQRGRLEALFAADMTLLAYHLPLDAHPVIGNNALLADALDVQVEQPFGEVGQAGRLRKPAGIEEVVARIREAVGGREPVVFAHGPQLIERIAICSGGSGGELIQAAHEGYDLYFTGEPEEPSLQTARELGIHFVAAGHDATERPGVQALARDLAQRFALEWEFIDVDNPV
ncbi:MAG TPA: Nif3-like dinuclear metal center hexameric protein [Gaiellaceae bacterium]|nr:Nif3-like dinuclear metal center hexameric protein [Gaiellaceae bacterium]